MSQKYLMRYPLIDGQGALGTQENNELVASSRYTEAKPSVYTDLMMIDYKKEPVATKETYNGEYMEPVVLPALFPNALCNGRQAIGISMSHGSLPHNLTEVCNAIIKYIENSDITIDELMEYIQGPDFPLGGTIINKKDIKTALKTGKSQTSLKVRGNYTIDNDKIIFTTIPYRTYRNKIKEQLEKYITEFDTCLDDFSDASNVGENNLIFYAKPGKVNILLAKLFKYTDLENTVSYNMNYIVNGTPKLCSIKDLIKAYVEHQNNIIINIAQKDLIKAKEKEHVLEGLLIAIKDIDTAIELIKSSLDKAEARNKLIKHFNLTEAQANAVLDLKLAKLTKLDKDDLLKQLEDIKLDIIDYTKQINEQNYRYEILTNKIINLRDKYGDARRTELTQIEDTTIEDKAEEIEPEDCVVVMTESGTIKRIPSSTFKTQRKNSKGVKTQDDITSCVIRTNTVDQLMIFTNFGNMYRLLVNDIPSGTNSSKGTPIISLIEMKAGEVPTTIYSIYKDTDAKYVMFITNNGLVKKSSLEEYIATKKKSGVRAINLREDDRIATAFLIKDEDVVITTAQGMGIRFASTEITPTGRLTLGVKGITLADGDSISAAMPIRHKTDDLAIITSNGVGKKIALTELPAQKRGGKGLTIIKLPDGVTVAAAALVENSDTVLIVGHTSSVCISAADIPLYTRASAGDHLIKNNRVKSISKI